MFEALLVAWGIVSFTGWIALWLWVRERYGRGGPIPVSQARGLLSPARGFMHPARATLESFHLRAGQTVLEIGPGPGYFTPAAAEIVGPEGRVLCLDVQPGMLALLRDRLRALDVTAAHPILADATRLPLADASVDAAFLVAVLGELPDRPAALAELRRALRPGATLSFLETITDPDYVFEGTLEDLCRATGFRPLERARQRLGYTATFVAPGDRE
jgi:ubiquinone/menaquinone biosynthesis C-methylase UbiE